MGDDPETGATWSGRGRAPAWLANVKNRTAFLIEGKGEAEPKATAARKRLVTPKKSTVNKS